MKLFGAAGSVDEDAYRTACHAFQIKANEEALSVMAAANKLAAEEAKKKNMHAAMEDVQVEDSDY